jgi:hypothetical protein
MKQLLQQIKLSLIETSNTINFPSYANNSPLIIQNNNNLIDLLDQSISYSSGQLNLDLDIKEYNNISMVYIFSKNGEFNYSINNSNFIATTQFLFNNLNNTITLQLYSNNPIQVDYFYLINNG